MGNRIFNLPVLILGFAFLIHSVTIAGPNEIRSRTLIELCPYCSTSDVLAGQSCENHHLLRYLHPEYFEEPNQEGRRLSGSPVNSPIPINVDNLEGDWVSLGPEGGWIYSMAIDPVNPSNVYAQTYGNPAQIYKSTDSGNDWTKISEINHYIYCMGIDPVNPSILYANYWRYLFKSTDGGSTWFQIQMTGESFYGRKIYVCPTNTNIIYVAGYVYTASTYRMAICKSTDGGTNWTVHYASPLTYQRAYAYSFAANPANANEIYIGGYVYNGSTYDGGVFKSTDGGVNWTEITGTIYGYVYALAVDPVNPNKLYAGTYSSVYRSTDSGNHWTAAVGNAKSYELVIDPLNPDIVYSGYLDAVYRSTNAGVNWMTYSSGLDGSCQALLIDPLYTNNLFYGSITGVYKSDNSGMNWFFANSGLIASTITSLATAPSQPTTIYLEFDNNAVFKSINSGNDWTRLNEFLACGNIGALGVHPTTPDIVYALEGSG